MFRWSAKSSSNGESVSSRASSSASSSAWLLLLLFSSSSLLPWLLLSCCCCCCSFESSSLVCWAKRRGAPHWMVIMGAPLERPHWRNCMGQRVVCGCAACCCVGEECLVLRFVAWRGSSVATEGVVLGDSSDRSLAIVEMVRLISYPETKKACVESLSFI